MHELEKKHTGMREKLEHLFHLDYGDPKPAGHGSKDAASLACGTVEQVQPQNSAPQETETAGRKKAFAFPRLSPPVCLAFGLGISLPLICSMASSLISENDAGLASTNPLSFVGSGASSASAPALALPIRKDASLSATHSTLSGVVDPRTLSASYYWSMTLANSSAARGQEKEAQMEISLPEGAVVSRATLWINGHPQEAAFNSTTQVRNAYEWITLRHRDPLLVTQRPDGHIMVQMSPVPTGGKEARLQIGITAPLDVKNAHTMRFPIPKMLNSNFKVEKQDVHIESPVQIFANNTKFTNQGSSGHFIFKGNVSNDELNNLKLQAAKPADLPLLFATRATHSDAGTFIVASLRQEEGAEEPKLILEKALSKPDCPIVNSEAVAHRLSSLWAGQEIARIYKSDLTTAVSLGTVYRVVSAVTGATVLEMDQDYQQNGLHRNRYQTVSYASAAEPSKAPLAHFSDSADSSGPDAFDSSASGDATTISGINTGTSVRVNNLANLEAMLNLLANGMEVFGLAWGGPTMIMGFMGMAGNAQSAMKRVMWGAASCAGGFALPGCINWLVSSARDGNLFS